MLNSPTSGFTEERFARWMETWADSLDTMVGWKDLVRYRDISAMDVGYLHFYFRILEQLRHEISRESGAEAPALVPARGPVGLARLVRIGQRLRSGEMSWADGIQIASERAAHRCRMLFSPATLKDLRGARTALVVRAGRNPTGYSVLEALQNEFGWRIQFASWTSSVAPRLHALGIPYVHLGDVYGRRLGRWRREHAQDISVACEKLDTRQLSETLAEIIGTRIRTDLLPLVRHVCCEARVYTDVYFDLFSHVRPEVIILFNEITISERAAARIAGRAGLKSIAIQHGLFIGYVYRSLPTDRIIVWGRLPREFWLAQGCSTEQVISVGGFGHENWPDVAKYFQVETATDRRPTVLVLGQNPAWFMSPQLRRESLRAVFDAATRLKSLRFVIKVHPGETPGSYEKEVQVRGLGNVEIYTSGDLLDFLRPAQVVVSIFSTAGLEAMLVGVPVIVLNPVPEPSLAPYAPATVIAGDGPALAQAIDRILMDAQYRDMLISSGREYAAAYIGPLDGKAATRAGLVIERFAGSNA